jgi:hypothetical protein
MVEECLVTCNQVMEYDVYATVNTTDHSYHSVSHSTQCQPTSGKQCLAYNEHVILQV